MDSVYPLNGGTDNFKKIQAQVRDASTNTAIAKKWYELDERDTTYTKVYIKDGSLTVKSCKTFYQGNNPDYGAYAVVKYPN